MITSREIRLKSRLVGLPSADNFELVTVSVPRPAPGEVQVQNLWMSVDPYMRGRMADRASYTPSSRPGKEIPGGAIGEIAASNSTMYGWRPSFQIGEALQGGAIGEVAASDDPRFKPGDLVSSWFGWRERFNAPAASLQKLDTFGLPPQAFLGVAGMPGLTAWVGLLKIATPKPGDVVFVSAASGAVGSAVCQIAKLRGHTVIGSAGGAAKCAFVKHIGADHVIDYRVMGDLTEGPAACGAQGHRCLFRKRGRRAPGGGTRSSQSVCSHCDVRNDLAIQHPRAAQRTTEHHVRHRQEPSAGGVRHRELSRSHARVPERDV